MNWQLLGLVSCVWLYVTITAGVKMDWLNVLIYGGIFMTNTGLAMNAKNAL